MLLTTWILPALSLQRLYLTVSRTIEEGELLKSTYGLLGNSCLLFKYGFLPDRPNGYSTTLIPSFLIIIALQRLRGAEDELRPSEGVRERLALLQEQRVFRCQPSVRQLVAEEVNERNEDPTSNQLMALVPSLVGAYASWDDFLDDSFVLSYDFNDRIRSSSLPRPGLPDPVDASESLWETVWVLSMTEKQYKEYAHTRSTVAYEEARSATPGSGKALSRSIIETHNRCLRLMRKASNFSLTIRIAVSLPFLRLHRSWSCASRCTSMVSRVVWVKNTAHRFKSPNPSLGWRRH